MLVYTRMQTVMLRRAKRASLGVKWKFCSNFRMTLTLPSTHVSQLSSLGSTVPSSDYYGPLSYGISSPFPPFLAVAKLHLRVTAWVSLPVPALTHLPLQDGWLFLRSDSWIIRTICTVKTLVLGNLSSSETGKYLQNLPQYPIFPPRFKILTSERSDYIMTALIIN